MKTMKLLAVSMVLGLMMITTGAFAQNNNPGVIPPHANVQGHGYSGWSAEWWKWFMSIPAPIHPTVASCAEGQSGKVFYLGANNATSAAPCQVPTGKSIFFPIVNVECSTAEDPPFHGSTEEELRDCAKCFGDRIDPSSLQVTIDGRDLKDLEKYRVASPLFTFEYPADNIFGIPDGPGSGQSVSDGYWIYLTPLSAGQHTVSFSGIFTFPAGECSVPFPPGTEVPVSGNYTLTVKGGK